VLLVAERGSSVRDPFPLWLKTPFPLSPLPWLLILRVFHSHLSSFTDGLQHPLRAIGVRFAKKDICVLTKLLPTRGLRCRQKGCTGKIPIIQPP